MWAVGGDHGPLLRGRCPRIGQQQIPPDHPNPHYNYKEGGQTNQCDFLSFFLNNDLCLSTTVVIIENLNSSLSTKVTYRSHESKAGWILL